MLPLIHIVVPAYNICCFLGLAAAALLLAFRVKKYGIAPLRAVQVCIFAATGMLAGSRLLFVFTQLPAVFSGNAGFTDVLLFGGFVFYGGLFGALAAVKIYSSVRRENAGQLFNMLVPCFLLFHSFGRIGCFLSGCCYGIEFPVGFEMVTSPGVIRFPVQLAECLCDLLKLNPFNGTFCKNSSSKSSIKPADELIVNIKFLNTLAVDFFGFVNLNPLYKRVQECLRQFVNVCVLLD